MNSSYLFVLLLFNIADNTRGIRGKDSPSPKGPHFAKDMPSSVVAAVGTPAHIPCKVRNLGNKTVTWIRHKYSEVLTADSYSFTRDERISARRDPSSEGFVLFFNHSRPSDTGYYNCSISTEPAITKSVKLEVVSDNTRGIRGKDSPSPKGPHFAKDMPSSVVAAVGTPAHIPCKVRNLGNKTVTWIRHKDSEVLTADSYTFIADERISAHRDPSSEDWVLVLRHSRPSDTGYYICSLSPKPAIAKSVKLEVVCE
ncbi:lachesin-like [Palaemon carinicauda]|uniref:lachesin-like n=1 Tax=Palaemon carinicauda TaxID=392227 RepID=UPI0035B5D431